MLNFAYIVEHFIDKSIFIQKSNFEKKKNNNNFNYN